MVGKTTCPIDQRAINPRSALSIYSVVPLFMSLLIGNPIAASAAAASCVVKLKFSSEDKSDSGTNAFVKQVLTGQGYKVIDDSLLTTWRASDYDVKIAITHTVVPNYGFPVDLMGMQLFIADSSGKVLVSGNIDRANLEDTLRASIPACGASSPSPPLPDSKAGTAPKQAE
jgi:hypothetical protein